MSDGADDTLDYWRNKCKDLEKVVKTLSSHCFQLVEKHEELLAKYKENEKQYNAVVARLKESEDQLLKMRKLYEPVYTEYEVMKNKYQIEAQCRYQAETYAQKVTVQNRDLKRKSQMVFAQHGLSLATIGDLDEEEKDDEESKAYLKSLNDKIEELEDKNSKLTVELREVKEDFEVEKEKKATYSYEVCNWALKEFLAGSEANTEVALTCFIAGNASDAASRDYDRLKGSFEKELLCRDKAEKYAATLFAEKEAARRQSSMLLMNVASDKKLMEAMIEVENLTTKVEEQKALYEQQIKDLKEELQQVKEHENVESLEQENEHLLDERENLQKQLSQTEEQVKTLQASYDKLSTQLEKGGAAVNTDYNKAIDEMMKRIKEGKALKPVLRSTERRPSCPDQDSETPSAMSELKGMLNNMKKARSVNDLSSPEPAQKEESELASVFRKIKRPSNPEELSAQIEEDVKRDRPTPRPRAKNLSVVSEREEPTGEQS
ncbi:hypothetical protein BaRGS_00039042 [Batillaria attramentaria]|uniref:Shootin-1 n=1 Tax=Batillaria attramentaria TaxID=370345 RepID=A0ABD0J451_9CAEN